MHGDGPASIKFKEIALPAVPASDINMIGSIKIFEKLPQPSPHGIGGPSNSSSTEPKPSETAASKVALMKSSQSKAATKAECPSELQLIHEAEGRHAVSTVANMAIYSADVLGAEATLLSIISGPNRKFVDSTRVYLLAAIAQYMVLGPATTPPGLLLRPANTLTKALDARSMSALAVPVQHLKVT